MLVPTKKIFPFVFIFFAGLNVSYSTILFSQPELSEEEFEIGKNIYFKRCAGCHGSLRQGATGPELSEESLSEKSDAYLENILTNGSGGGMPAFGARGILSPEEIHIMAQFIRLDSPTPPKWGVRDMRSTWKVSVPENQRPTTKQNNLNLDNIFAVTLRDSGEVAIIDGDSKQVVSIIKTGYAVHISRFSSSGRYIYSIGRDGQVHLIDLWMAVPAAVAEIRIGIEARSIEVSKFPGYEDKYIIAGGYWPNQFVILDGLSLEPIKIKSTSTAQDGENSEARVAAIVSSTKHPEFIVNVKETGKILLVSYADEDFCKITSLDAPKFLHDGGWDASHRYFMAAANKSNKIVVVDAQERTVVKSIDVGELPHPGRGANFNDSQFGPVWATPHLGDDHVSVISTDPSSANSWQVVRELPMPGSGSLFIKTHPNSKNLWVDMVLSVNEDLQQSLVVYDLESIDRPYELLKLAEMVDLGEGPLKFVHPEYNTTGDEMWISVWNSMNHRSAILVIDDKTRQLKHVIDDPRIITPTGKFNNYNTRHDVY